MGVDPSPGPSGYREPGDPPNRTPSNNGHSAPIGHVRDPQPSLSSPIRGNFGPSRVNASTASMHTYAAVHLLELALNELGPSVDSDIEFALQQAYWYCEAVLRGFGIGVVA